jgi:hypothetical protein
MVASKPSLISIDFQQNLLQKNQDGENILHFFTIYFNLFISK